MKRLILPFILILFSFVPFECSLGQTLGILCVNRTTKAITVQTRCTGANIQVSANTILPAVGGINFATCYSRTGRSEGSSGANTDVSVTISCNRGDVMVSDGFETSDAVRVNPQLTSKRLIFNSNGKTANGVQYETSADGGAGGPNSGYYTVTVRTVCCPAS